MAKTDVFRKVTHFLEDDWAGTVTVSVVVDGKKYEVEYEVIDDDETWSERSGAQFHVKFKQLREVTHFSFEPDDED
jgi:hypothetical protein